MIPGTNMIAGGGKEGKLYLLDRTAMEGRYAVPDQEIRATLDLLPPRHRPPS